MPMIDVYAPADLFPADADGQLGNELARAVLSAEGVSSPGDFHLDNTAAFIHRLPAAAISTANAGSARNVRIQIITPPGSLSRDGQKQITKEATEIVARIAGDETQAQRTWVILSEAAEGGWGINGTHSASRSSAPWRPAPPRGPLPGHDISSTRHADPGRPACCGRGESVRVRWERPRLLELAPRPLSGGESTCPA